VFSFFPQDTNTGEMHGWFLAIYNGVLAMEADFD